MKLNAVCGRDEYKDYYDLAELSTLTGFREWPVFWAKVYPKSDPISWIVALAHIGSVVDVPLWRNSVQDRNVVEEIIRMIVKEISSSSERDLF